MVMNPRNACRVSNSYPALISSLSLELPTNSYTIRSAGKLAESIIIILSPLKWRSAPSLPRITLQWYVIRIIIQYTENNLINNQLS